MNVVRWDEEVRAPDGVHLFLQWGAEFPEALLRRAFEAYRGRLVVAVRQNRDVRWHLYDPSGPPLDVPGLWHHDGLHGWRRDDTQELIVGRQNQPEFWTAWPGLMVGTAEQARSWRELVGRGEAHAFALPPEDDQADSGAGN